MTEKEQDLLLFTRTKHLKMVRRIFIISFSLTYGTMAAVQAILIALGLLDYTSLVIMTVTFVIGSLVLYHQGLRKKAITAAQEDYDDMMKHIQASAKTLSEQVKLLEKEGQQ